MALFWLACLLSGGVDGPAAPLVATSCVLLSLLAAHSVVWEVDSDGLVLRRRFRAPRRYGWQEIGAVTIGEAGAMVELADGETLRFGRACRNWCALATCLQQAVRRHRNPADDDAPLPADHLAALLGLSPGETKRYRAPWWARVCKSPLILAAPVAVAAVAAALRVPYSLLPTLAVFVSMCVGWRQAGGLGAAPAGVVVHADEGPRTVAWADIRAVSPWWLPRGWLVHHPGGSFFIPADMAGADHLLALCRRVIALRDSGQRMPESVPELVPAGALSRMTGDEAEAERGISLSADEPA